ncbi:MAG: hypothetical protein US54_C0039G0001 [Candidatus Roizmanbacteria bacterium GW2011_GWA2_37_7]|uniref:SpoVT-AbrB domain-containing protein n=1 Tax=Candidatus Roizmanbacteria bacterium GW2011_GWA2_37_7 TaxID=1618481 RepID=A0A0G0HFG5_9BACT|nr:MAG: hypothetical protein US54_C0039G0001 [Candidatus Roizmanbacteria bacterium GW2011_GWA2_37_7]
MSDTTHITISPQGQITIPKSWRNALNVKKGTKIIAHLKKTSQGVAVILSPQPENWTDLVAGSGTGLWSDSDTYISKERSSWK